MGKTVPELVHRYPTYRFDIALGRISRGDTGLIGELHGTVVKEIESHAVGLVFCPVGVGRHVDHLIARSVGEQSVEQPVFYSDFPYNQHQQPDDTFLQRRSLTGWQWSGDLQAKHQRVRQYATQADALFPDGRIPLAPETYYS
jgi:hypothetical protein